jgi:hypothetical protein
VGELVELGFQVVVSANCGCGQAGVELLGRLAPMMGAVMRLIRQYPGDREGDETHPGLPGELSGAASTVSNSRSCQ